MQTTHLQVSIDVGWPGSLHDSRILKNSAVYNCLLHNATGFPLADSGFALTPFIMTPNTIANGGTDAQKYFNKVHSQKRVVIEQCFGPLKCPFPILRFGITLS